MKQCRKLLALMLLLIVSGSVLAQDLFDKAKLDNYFSKLEENNKFMGSVAVAKNGEIIYTKSVGFADVENNVKATEKSKYRIGSVFADALFGGRLLTNESLEIMKTIKDEYGLGLFEIPFGENIGLGHTGAIDGFVSVYSHFADGNISYALISNGRNFKIGDINKAVLSAVYGKPYELPEFYNVVSEDLDIYLGVYVSKKIGLDFIVTKEGNTLIGQIGDDVFSFEAVDKDKFKYDPIGATFEFNPKKNTMTLFQYGAKLVLRRKK